MKTAALAVVAMCAAFSAEATLSPRVQVHQRGGYVLLGNTLVQDCRTAVPAPVVGTIGDCGSNFTGVGGDVFWRSDQPAAGQATADGSILPAQARSTAVLQVPAGATVTHAYLYWVARTPIPGVPGTTAYLDAPSFPGNALTATASVLHATSDVYQSVADVTALVQQWGAGAYSVWGVSSRDVRNGGNGFASWWMVVVYRRAADPSSTFTVYDGLELVTPSAPFSQVIPGFAVPSSGGTKTLGVVGYMGAASATGSLFKVNGTPLVDAQNPLGSFFNGSRSNLGAAVSQAGDLPQLTGGPDSMTGLDLDVVDVTSLVGAGATSLLLGATEDFFGAFLGGIVLQTPVAEMDLSVSLTDSVTTAAPGSSVTYDVVFKNNNPGSVDTNIAVANPAGLTCVWNPNGIFGVTHPGFGANAPSLSTPATFSSFGTLQARGVCSVPQSATGSLTAVATVTPTSPVVDSNPSNDTATDVDLVVPSSAISVTIDDGVTTVQPGGYLAYVIVIRNSGPSDAPTVSVADTFPSSLACNAWNGFGTGGATFPAVGSGNLNVVVGLPVGATVTYLSTCSVPLSATSSISRTVTAAAPPPWTDPNAADNSASDTDTVLAANLGVTVTDGVTTTTPGGTVTYTITASNSGPSPATGATVTDTFPAALSCTWTCLGATGGSCTPSGTGNIADTVNLPVGGTVTYTAACKVSSVAVGSISNTATVATPPGTLELSPSNDSATDIDSLPSSLTLSATKAVAGSFAPGSTVAYTILLSNAGPAAQGDNPGHELTDVLPAGLTLVSATATSGSPVATAATNTVTWDGAIPPGGTVSITVVATVGQLAPGTVVSNQGTVSYDADGNGTNEASLLTGDPATGGAGPTRFTVTVTAAVAVPGPGPLGLGALAVALGLLGAVLLRSFPAGRSG